MDIFKKDVIEAMINSWFTTNDTDRTKENIIDSRILFFKEYENYGLGSILDKMDLVDVHTQIYWIDLLKYLRDNLVPIDLEDLEFRIPQHNFENIFTMQLWFIKTFNMAKNYKGKIETDGKTFSKYVYLKNYFERNINEDFENARMVCVLLFKQCEYHQIFKIMRDYYGWYIERR